MNRNILFIILLLSSLLMGGCARKFILPRGEIPVSKWNYPRRNVQSVAQIESAYKGGLNLIWEKHISDMPIAPLTMGVGNLILCGAESKAYFFDSKTGHPSGRIKSDKITESGLLIIDTLAYYNCGINKSAMNCINLHSGHSIWRLLLKDMIGTPIIIENRLFIAADTGTGYCIDRLTGKILWSRWIKSKSPAGPSYDEGMVYYPSDNGTVSCLDAKMGEMKFQIELNEPLMSKAAVGDYIYLSGANGGFFALDKMTGKPRWAKEFPWPIWTSPTVDGKSVFIGDNGGYLRALDVDSGKILWEFKSDGVIVSSPIVVGEFLLFASLDRNIYCLDKKNGLLVSKRQLKHEVRFPIVSDGYMIFFAEQDGTIQCLGD